MSSCGSSNCSCGSDCKCGNGCGCSMFLDITEMTTTSQILIAGLAPAKGFYEGSGMGVGAENDGCKCGSSCSCDNCSCK